MNLGERTFKRNDYKVTSPFGPRVHPVTKAKSFHSGLDYGTGLAKWSVYAIEQGKVLASNYDLTNGHYIWVEYPRIDLKIFYCHLDRRFVNKGAIVDDTTIIGLVGRSGRATGIHLHMGVKRISTNAYFNHAEYDYQPKGTSQYIYLSRLVPSWRVYPLNKDCKVGNEIGKLAPMRFGGLRFEILDTLPNDVYVINSATFGKVKLWAGKGSLHTIKGE
jgi:murein DD-endopeptidase MepM/ murein hydrolase activator NlpD